MRPAIQPAVCGLLLGVALLLPAQSGRYSDVALKAVQQSTVGQAGTAPFHLLARYAPLPETQPAAGAIPTTEHVSGPRREGTIEFWWMSPTVWRREVRSPEFHQVLIVNGGARWEQSEGEYYPEWLRELANALVRPVPLSPADLERSLKLSDVRRQDFWDHRTHVPRLQVSFHWYVPEEVSAAETERQGTLAMMSNTGFVGTSGLAYGTGEGWGGRYDDFRKFHGLRVARTVLSGNVMARMAVLEDLPADSGKLFDLAVAAVSAAPIDTVVVSEDDLRSHWITDAAPPVTVAAVTFQAHAEILVARDGTVRELSAVSAPAKYRAMVEKRLLAQQFRPVERNGTPVQALGRFHLEFHLPLIPLTGEDAALRP